MGIPYQYCSNCFTPFLPGTRYCTNCGQAVDPVLVAELQWLYRSLKDLDARIAAGQGDSTITQLRDLYREDYLAQRQSEVSERPATTQQASPPERPFVPQPPTTPAPSPAGAYIARARAANEASGAMGTPPPAAPATPEPRPIFSWREFVQEQAIAIMAYLGGFLLLVATLSFEVGAWQFLTNGVKLIVVAAVYVVFGILGFAMRQAERLRTVGRAYLGVFALMTPLVCLAVYRFALQPLNFNGYAMLSLSSFYAAVVYLALAWRTRFATYSYLGWVGLLVGALAIIPWQALPWDWWTFTVALVALVMLIPREFRRFEAVAIVVDSGTQLAGVATAAAIIGVEFQGMMIWGAAIGATEPGGPPLRSAFALAACALALLAAMWGLTLRRLNQQVERAYLDIADWFVVAFGAQAVVAIAAWAHADRPALTYLLAALAVAQIVVMAGLKWLAPERGSLRLSTGGLGLGLAIVAIFVVIGGSLPNWPLVAALSAGGLVALSLTAMESQPAFIIIGGIFFSLAYHIAVVTFYPDGPGFLRSGLPYPDPVVALYEAGFALGIWLVALGIGIRQSWQSWRPYAGLTYLVASGNALYAAFLILFYPGHDLTTQTIVLVAFTAAALIGGLREQALDLGGIAFGLFGLLAVIPTTIRSENGLTIGATVIVTWLITIGIRRVIGRAWMIAAYVVALWATVLASLHFTLDHTTTTSEWSLFGIPFAAWLLLASAIAASIAAFEENAASLTIFPALMGLGAVLETTDHVAPAVLVFVLIAAAMLSRRLRDATWGVAWYASAVLASIFATNALGGLGNGLYWQTIFTLALAAVAYAVAAFERQWIISLVALPYVIAALSLLPASNNFIPTLAITFGTVALGMLLRFAPVASLRFRAEWSLGLYGSAVAGSIFAIIRVTPFDAAHVEAWLLIFAAVAYIAAIIERQPIAGIAPSAYAVAAVAIQPDAHALLPLSLALAVLGLVAGRVAGGWRWSWPPYAVAAIAAAATVGQSQGDLIFAAQALAIIAATTYLIAAIEARPDVLVGALIVGAVALGETAVALRWPAWQGVLAFAALSWGYMALHWLWRVLPWLHPRGGAWWAAFAGGTGLGPDHPASGGTESSGAATPSGSSADPARLNDPRAAGVEVHRLGSLVLGLGTVVAAMIGVDTFTPFNIATETVVVALASFAGLLALQALLSPDWHALWYFAGGAVALAISWQTRWFGADNVQAYILAPGSYQLVIGALLPVDRRLGQPNWAGQLFSLTGALTLMVPTLAQSFQPDQDWIYAIVLAGEAILVSGVGVGTRSHVLVAAGLGFVGLAAIRGSVLAVNSGVPIAVIIGVIALLLMGAATWLSLRLRREATP
jgi:hypothetical protein